MSKDSLTVKKLLYGGALFIKFFLFSSPMIDKIKKNNYVVSPIPGSKKDISGSIVTGYNIGINNYIVKERKEASLKALNYMVTMEFQKKYVKKDLVMSAIKEIYYDEEVCEIIDCEIYRNVQLVALPTGVSNDFNNYFENFKNFVYAFLYKNEMTAPEALKNIINLIEVHKITINSKDSYFGLIIFAISTFFSVIMFLSLVFLFIEKYFPYFEFLPADCWIFIVLGSISILSVCYTFFGEINTTRCFLKYILSSFGITLILTSVLYKLIINFPGYNNKITNYINKHKYQYFFVFSLINLTIEMFILLAPYDIHEVYAKNNLNFKICKMKNVPGKIIIYLGILYKFLIIMISLALLFVEWNLRETYHDIRLVTAAMYINIIYFILYIILDYVVIKNFIGYYITNISLIIVISLTNYIILYGYRIIIGFFRKKDRNTLFINNVNKNFINNESINTSSKPTTTSIVDDSITDSKRTTMLSGISIINKMINYHYSTGIVAYSSSDSCCVESSAVYKTDI